MNLHKSKTAKVVAGFVGILTAVTMIGGAALPASAATAEELQAQINSLLATIQALQAQLGATTTGGSGATACTFTRDLTIGVTGDDVKCLQQYLNSKGFTVSATGAGSVGNESTYFGAKTAAAAGKWQAANGVTPSVGYFGAKSRAKYAAIGGTGPVTTPGTTPAGSGLSVFAGSQPSASIAPEGASRVPFTRVVLTASNDGDVLVNGITVERTGLANDAVFAGVVLLDQDGLQIGVAKTLNSNHQVTVGAPFTVPRGTSKTVTIAGNMQTGSTALDAYAGQVVALSVVGVQTSATVNGSLPITGAAHTINATLTIGSATLIVSSFDPNSAQTKNIGDSNVRFAGVRVTAGSSEAVRLWSIRFNQSGSAGANDLANVKVYVDGTAYPTTVSSDGKYYTAMFGSGLMIDKGLSKDVYIQGDLVGSSITNRTVQMDVYKNTDVYVTGETYMYGITPTANGNCATTSTTASEFIYSSASCAGTASTPFFNASLFTVNPGTATSISKATSVTAQNIAVNVPNQVLGGFTTTFTGEPVSVQSMVFAFATSAVAWGGPITSITIVDENGAVVAGPVDQAANATNGTTVTFTDTVTFPVGTKTYTVKGKIPSNTANNATVVVSTTPSTGWTNVQGQISGNSITTLPSSTVTMNTMTVKSANLALSLSTTPASQSVVAGGTMLSFANVQLDAQQSGEDLRVSQVKLRSSGSGSLSNLSSCQVYNGSTVLNTGSNVLTTIVSGANTFNFDNNITVPKGTLVTLTLKCNLAAGATGTYQFDLNASDTITATGVTSGTSLTVTPTAASGGTMTVNTSTLNATLDSSSPSYTVAANGTTGVTVGVLRFTTTNEAINLNKIALQLDPSASTTIASASSTPSDVTMVSLWDGSTQVGSATFTGVSRYATSSLSSIVSIPKDSYKLITVKVDLPTLNSQAGVGNNPKPGALVKVDFDDSDPTGTQGTGVDSGTTINAAATASGDTASAGIRVFKSYPVFTYSTTGGNLTNGALDLLTLNVQANSSGEIQLNKLIFSIATTTVTVTSPTFSGPSGNVGASAPTITGLSSSNSGVVTVTFDSTSNTADKTIGAGQTKTYTLRGTVTGLTTTAGSISVALKADTSYPALDDASLTGRPLMGNTSDTGIAASNIIWSPNSTTTSATTNNDWTNAYGLGGCFATAGLGQNCTARVLAN